MHETEKVSVKCVNCQKLFESRLILFMGIWVTKAFCSDSCRDCFFDSNPHEKGCLCPHCCGADKK